jgi:hypothetical protein
MHPSATGWLGLALGRTWRSWSNQRLVALVVYGSLGGLGCSGRAAEIVNLTDPADGGMVGPSSTLRLDDASPAGQTNASSSGDPISTSEATVSAAEDSTPDATLFAPVDAAFIEDATDTAQVSDVDGGVEVADASDADRASTDGGVDSETEGAYSSCLAILKAAPASASGTYFISLSGASLAVHCDMAFAGGGWTLVQSTNGGLCTPATEAPGSVTLASCAYMPAETLAELAELSTTVHVRTASGLAPPVAYITSDTDGPIQNLRVGLVANANEPVGDAASEEAAWTVVGDPGNTASQDRTPESILAFTCAVTGDIWPAVYRACGNGADGFVLDVADDVSLWNWGLPHVNVPMEVYVR